LYCEYNWQINLTLASLLLASAGRKDESEFDGFSGGALLR
jgi:hypothetical protein